MNEAITLSIYYIITYAISVCTYYMLRLSVYVCVCVLVCGSVYMYHVVYTCIISHYLFVQVDWHCKMMDAVKKCNAVKLFVFVCVKSKL